MTTDNEVSEDRIKELLIQHGLVPSPDNILLVIETQQNVQSYLEQYDEGRLAEEITEEVRVLNLNNLSLN